ncbi:MAG TPA: segregation/condensation protein A [Firmicutes bacterium]|nr:segregation/condensation protein A [Bacillota bacterium]
MSYFVILDEFEGPLDLLLYLVEKNEVDLLNIPIIDITNQYLEYLDKMRKFNASLASEFVVMAARLVYLKSRMLLPPGSLSEEEERSLEEDKQEIEEAIREYKKFKEVANRLKLKAEYQHQMFPRPSFELSEIKVKKELDFEDHVLSEVKLFNLINAFKSALARAVSPEIIEIIKEQFSIDEKIRQLIDKFKEKPEWTLRELCKDSESKLEIIITVLTILELTNMGIVTLDQLIPFGTIFVKVLSDISDHDSKNLIKEMQWK